LIGTVTRDEDPLLLVYHILETLPLI